MPVLVRGWARQVRKYGHAITRLKLGIALLQIHLNGIQIIETKALALVSHALEINIFRSYLKICRFSACSSEQTHILDRTLSNLDEPPFLASLPSLWTDWIPAVPRALPVGDDYVKAAAELRRTQDVRKWVYMKHWDNIWGYSKRRECWQGELKQDIKQNKSLAGQSCWCSLYCDLYPHVSIIGWLK